MARPKNSEEKINTMRNRMMDAVVELMDEVVPEKVSIRMIAEKIGVSHMVFYTYFKDREEIMQALVKRQQSRITSYFTGMLEKAANKPVADVLGEVLREYVDSARAHPIIFRLFWITPKDARKDGQATEIPQFLPSINNLTQLLKMGMDRGEFSTRNPKLAATVVMMIVNAPLIMDQCGTLPHDFSCEECLDQIINAVFAYLKS